MLERRIPAVRSGQLILWHGPPGHRQDIRSPCARMGVAGWCRVHYVTDPETFFGTNPRYMLDLILDEEDDETVAAPGARGHRRAARGRREAPHRPRPVAAPERRRRADRPGLRILVLVTTNEQVGTLNPAVARPGRCAAVVEFTEFDAERGSRVASAQQHVSVMNRSGDACRALRAARRGSSFRPGAASVSPDPTTTTKKGGARCRT